MNINVDDHVKVEGLFGKLKVVGVDRIAGTIDVVSPAMKKKTVFEDKCTLVKHHVTKDEKEQESIKSELEDIDLGEDPTEEELAAAEEESEDELTEDEVSEEELAAAEEETSDESIESTGDINDIDLD